MISAGNLKQTLEFYSVASTKNEYNETVKSLVFEFRTKGEQIRSETETIINSEGVDSSGVATFKVRFNRRIKTKMVLKFNGSDFEITNGDNRFNNNREMYIDAINYTQD